jgi:hypothetical protein
MEQSFLVLPGPPATIDEELDSVVRGIRCSFAQGAEEGWIEVGYTRNLVIEDRRAVGDGAICLARRTTVATAVDADGGCGRRGRVRQQRVAEGRGDRRDDD